MRFMRCEQDHNCARKDGHVRSAGRPSGLGPEAYLADVLASIADDPASRIAAGKLADQPADARDATAELAAAYEPADLYRRRFRLDEQFRPGVPAGESGWGALGELDLAKVRALVPTG
jgi:hypothetical protein